ncbi:MAG TPA: hypothetical protein VEC06_05570 [Paucimonas sp.]|nr:hypothetical protein [Paucimonas sp.]
MLQSKISIDYKALVGIENQIDNHPAEEKRNAHQRNIDRFTESLGWSKILLCWDKDDDLDAATTGRILNMLETANTRDDAVEPLHAYRGFLHEQLDEHGTRMPRPNLERVRECIDTLVDASKTKAMASSEKIHQEPLSGHEMNSVQARSNVPYNDVARLILDHLSFKELEGKLGTDGRSDSRFHRIYFDKREEAIKEADELRTDILRCDYRDGADLKAIAGHLDGIDKLPPSMRSKCLVPLIRLFEIQRWKDPDFSAAFDALLKASGGIPTKNRHEALMALTDALEPDRCLIAEVGSVSSKFDRIIGSLGEVSVENRHTVLRRLLDFLSQYMDSSKFPDKTSLSSLYKHVAEVYRHHLKELANFPPERQEYLQPLLSQLIESTFEYLPQDCLAENTNIIYKMIKARPPGSKTMQSATASILPYLGHLKLDDLMKTFHGFVKELAEHLVVPKSVMTSIPVLFKDESSRYDAFLCVLDAVKSVTEWSRHYALADICRHVHAIPSRQRAGALWEIFNAAAPLSADQRNKVWNAVVKAIEFVPEKDQLDTYSMIDNALKELPNDSNFPTQTQQALLSLRHRLIPETK